MNSGLLSDQFQDGIPTVEAQPPELGGFQHHMLKEIFEQPRALSTCMGGRIDRHDNRIKLGGIASYLRELTHTKRLILTACGTAFHASLVGEFLFEHLARI